MAGLPKIRQVFMEGNMGNSTWVEEEVLDLEWMVLIMEAKQLGISKEEILHFLRFNENEKIG